MTRIISRNMRYIIRRDESSFWYIEDRTTGKVVSDHDGDPIVFIEASEAEDWITTHDAPGWGARKETT